MATIPETKSAFAVIRKELEIVKAAAGIKAWGVAKSIKALDSLEYFLCKFKEQHGT
jgi:hypothetical protein